MIAEPIVDLNARQAPFFDALMRMASDEWSNLDNDNACQMAQLLYAIEVLAELQMADAEMISLLVKAYRLGRTLRLDLHKATADNLPTAMIRMIMTGPQ